MVQARIPKWKPVFDDLVKTISKKKVRNQSFFKKEKTEKALAFLPEEQVKNLESLVSRNHKQWSSKIQLKAVARQKEWQDYRNKLKAYDESMLPEEHK